MNALLNERDQTLSVAAIREHEQGMTDDDPGLCTNSLHEMRVAGVAACVATLIARSKPVSPLRKPTRRDLDYPSQALAYAAAQGQLAYYRLLERQGHIRVLEDGAALEHHWQQWQTSVDQPIGVILTMECADPIVEPAQVHEWFAQGLRSLMLAHFTQSQYAMGTVPRDGSVADGPITPRGRELLREMGKLAMALDLTHLCDQSFFEAVDLWSGPVLASHSNCRALADSPRQLSDEQLRVIVQREGVVGVALHYGMLRCRFDAAGQWALRPDEVGLDTVADHIDHICQLAGDASHVAIGSDLDGGFGALHSTRDLDTARDLTKLEPLLLARGYAGADVAAIFHGNWLGFYRKLLPAGDTTAAAQGSTEPSTAFSRPAFSPAAHGGGPLRGRGG